MNIDPFTKEYYGPHTENRLERFWKNTVNRTNNKLFSVYMVEIYIDMHYSYFQPLYLISILSFLCFSFQLWQYTFSDLLNVVQASEKELWDALEKQQACLINGKYHTLQPFLSCEVVWASSNCVRLLACSWGWLCRAGSAAYFDVAGGTGLALDQSSPLCHLPSPEGAATCVCIDHDVHFSPKDV